MSTIYVDVNAQNSKIETKENNIYEYQLPRPLNLPTGTEINIQNSLVNLQGITGASIEIQEDINEKVIFQYYVTDSTYQVPNFEIAPRTADLVNFNIFSESDVHRNFNGDGNEFAPNIMPDTQQGIGYSETIMPLMTEGNISLGGDPPFKSYMPFCGEVDITIPKGIYSISEIATLITNQMNGLGETGQTSITDLKTENKYNGQIYNGTTNRGVLVRDAQFWVTAYSVPGSLNINGLDSFAPVTANDTVTPDVVAFTCKCNNDRLDEIRQGFLGNQDDKGNDLANLKTNYASATGTAGRYNITFREINQPIRPGPTSIGVNNPLKYNIFSQQNMGVGTSGFQLSYSTENSAFSMKNLHEPRKIPTHDRFGNKLPNPGTNVVYMKRLCQDKITTLSLNKTMTSTLNAPVQRFSVIMVYKWAYNTANKLGVGIKNKLKINKDKADIASKFFRFQDFFNNDEEAELAWNTTIWGRLGFSFNDIQAESSFTRGTIFGTEQLSNGFTTGMEIDSSAQPFISTLFNGASSVAQTADPKQPNQIIPVPSSITSIQLFNLFDSSVPRLQYNNNKNAPEVIPGEGTQGVVAPYQGSFYTGAVMIPIQTDGFEVIASRLPVLSERGYLYVLSNLIEPNDIVKLKDEVGLLDQLPISNLSNQDFIADRTAIIHTLSNPKIINSIRIMILNPDLTNVDLQPNSSMLIKITLPVEKQTEVVANIKTNIEENALEQSIIKEQQQQAKQQAKQQKSTSL